MFAGTEGDGVDHVSQVRLEPCRDVDRAQASLEVGDFEALGNELLPELLFPGAAGVEVLAGSQGASVYGGDEAIGDGVDGFIDVGVRAQKDLGGARRYWGKFLAVLLESSG